MVVISHDHYDHLDKGAVKVLADKVGTFLVPLRVGALLEKWGVDKEKIIELNWWESATASDIEFTLTPTQHFSGVAYLIVTKHCGVAGLLTLPTKKSSLAVTPVTSAALKRLATASGRLI